MPIKARVTPAKKLCTILSVLSFCKLEGNRLLFLLWRRYIFSRPYLHNFHMKLWRYVLFNGVTLYMIVLCGFYFCHRDYIDQYLFSNAREKWLLSAKSKFSLATPGWIIFHRGWHGEWADDWSRGNQSEHQNTRNTISGVSNLMNIYLTQHRMFYIKISVSI